MTSMAERLRATTPATPPSVPQVESAELQLVRRVRARITGAWQQRMEYGRTYEEFLSVREAIRRGLDVPPDCPSCLAGAVSIVTGLLDSWREEDRLARVLGFDHLLTMVRWNDQPDRTHEQVIARLDAAIGRLEAQQ